MRRLLAPLACAALATAQTCDREVTTWHVYAVRYATLPDFPVASLVAGADAARRMDIAMTVWLLESFDGQAVLVDAGFYREKFLARWKPRDYVRPSDATERIGAGADRVYDIVVSHVHWDHLDGVDLFPEATVWIQREEYDHHVDGAGRPRAPAIDPENAAMLARLKREDRLMLVDGDNKEILPGIRVHTGGRHTYASQYVTVRTPRGTVVLASDNLYLYENLERGVPIAQTVDAQSNLRAQRRMLGSPPSPRGSCRATIRWSSSVSRSSSPASPRFRADTIHNPKSH